MRKAVVFLATVLFLTFSSVVYAISWFDNFSDVIMDDSMWIKCYDGGVDSGFLTETGGIEGVLQWAPTATGEQYEDYALNYAIDFSNDFGFRVDFINTYLGDADGASGVQMALRRQDNSLSVGISAEFIGATIWNQALPGEPYVDGRIFSAGLKGPDQPFYHRSIDSGWLGMEYLAGTTDFFRIAAFAHSDYEDPVWGVSIEKFTETYGSIPMSLSIGGWSKGTVMLSGGASLDNFMGFVTPEPVSSVLFLVGGASLIAARLRRRKK